MPKFPLAALAAVSLIAISADAQRRRDQDEVRQAYRAGQAMSLAQIEDRVVPKMGGADYLGPEYDRGSGIYRLKFMRSGSVIWIDVDARTGQVVGRSGY